MTFTRKNIILGLFLLWMAADATVVLLNQGECPQSELITVFFWLTIANQLGTWAILMIQGSDGAITKKLPEAINSLLIVLTVQFWFGGGMVVPFCALVSMKDPLCIIPLNSAIWIAHFTILLLINLAFYIACFARFACLYNPSAVAVETVDQGLVDAQHPVLNKYVAQSRPLNRSQLIESDYQAHYEASGDSGPLDSEASPRPAVPTSPSAPPWVSTPTIAVVSDMNPPSPPYSAPHAPEAHYRFTAPSGETRAQIRINIPGTVPPVALLVG